MKHIILLLTGVLIVMGLSGCGEKKYNLVMDKYGFRSEKTSYAEGERVKVIYPIEMIGTDTDYRFSTDSEDVKLRQSFDGEQGYILKFTMPAHDVKMIVDSRNTMTADPDANVQGPQNRPPVPEDCISNDNLLFDYYEATVATVGGNEYSEYCLYKYGDAGLVLAYYRAMEDSDETMVYCIVPTSVLDECMDLVKHYKMRRWKNGRGLNGKRYVVKFMDHGDLNSVSSDDMPENGRDAFGAICGVLDEAWGRYYSPPDSETWFCPECGAKNNGKYCTDCGLKKPE
ncbi:MAG: hypothetical protein K6F34_10840 [Lachnospiraceae bacterium]|nr:hypothetical protein [Lachnospiraceae bacterium]